MSLLTLQMPALPDPVKVVLQPATTALLVFDMIDRICQNQPNCTGVMVPALAALLARGRKAGVFVLYSTREPESSKWMPEVAPAPGDTSVGATLRGYTVVVPMDASLAATDYEVAIGQFQILNQNSANTANEPLKANASTLSRTDMIVFQ